MYILNNLRCPLSICNNSTRPDFKQQESLTNLPYLLDECYVVFINVPLKKRSNRYTLPSTKFIRTPSPVHNHRHKLLNLIPKTLTIETVEELLVLRLILVSDLEEIGQPPGGRDVDVTLGAGDNQVSFCLDADAQGDGRGGVGVVDDRLGEDVHSILHPGVKIDIRVIAAEEFDDGEQGQGRMLVHGAAGLSRVELTGGRRDHLGKGGLHVHDIADDAALDHRNQMGESWTEGRLTGFQEDEAFLVGKVVKLFGFLCAEYKRNLA